MAKTQTTFKEGQQKLGGREKGTPNKLTTETRHVILLAIDEQSKHFDLTMERIREENPVDWAKIIVKMMDFVLPKSLNIQLGGKIINVISDEEKNVPSKLESKE